MEKFLESHQCNGREVQIDGQTFLHLHCRRCGRDFAKRVDGTEWRAVHLGIFQFNLLDELTQKRWTSEECPGQPRMAELNDMRRNAVASPIVRHRALSRS